MALLPSTQAVQLLVKNKIFPFAASMQAQLALQCPHDPWMLPQDSFLGAGGNGITFEYMLRGHKFAVKWVSCYYRHFHDVAMS